MSGVLWGRNHRGRWQRDGVREGGGRRYGDGLGRGVGLRLMGPESGFCRWLRVVEVGLGAAGGSQTHHADAQRVLGGLFLHRRSVKIQ